VLASRSRGRGDGAEVRVHQLLASRRTAPEQAVDDVQRDVEQRGERADVRDVLHEQPLAAVVERVGAHARERHAEEVTSAVQRSGIGHDESYSTQPPACSSMTSRPYVALFMATTRSKRGVRAV
jgi:hypothetical protein